MSFPISNWEEARDCLRKYREEQIRKSDEILQIWKETLRPYKHKLGSEEWLVIEQVCIAACDCRDLSSAKECYSLLKKQFPESSRVTYLKGLIEEASLNFEKAQGIYNQLLEVDDTNSVCFLIVFNYPFIVTKLIRKRLVALLKGQNKTSEAIKQLSEYLEKFMSDFEAWLELVDLYLNEMDFQKAAFCMEELLLAHPFNHLIHQKYAEIKYSQGGLDNIEISKKYFAHSLKLHPTNLRSLFGFYMAATHLAQKVNIKSKKEKHLEHANFAWKQIQQKYQSASEKMTKDEVKKDEEFLTTLFDNLQINVTNCN